MSQLTKQQNTMLQAFQSHMTGKRYGDAIAVGQRLLRLGLSTTSEAHYAVLNDLGIAYELSGDQVNVYMEGGEVRFRSLDHLRRAVEVAQSMGRTDLVAKTTQLMQRLPNSYFETLFSALD